MGDQPKGTALVVSGDLNTDLGDVDCDGRGAEIAAAITEAGLKDMAAHFLPRKRRWGEGTVDVGDGEGGESGKVLGGLHPGD